MPYYYLPEAIKQYDFCKSMIEDCESRIDEYESHVKYLLRVRPSDKSNIKWASQKYFSCLKLKETYTDLMYFWKRLIPDYVLENTYKYVI